MISIRFRRKQTARDSVCFYDFALHRTLSDIRVKSTHLDVKILHHCFLSLLLLIFFLHRVLFTQQLGGTLDNIPGQ